MHPADPARYDQKSFQVRCGKSGLHLPKVSLGLWHNFGSVDDYANARAIALRAFDLGVTHFDLANNYGPVPGSAEETFGRILREDLGAYRDELIVSTKVGYTMWPGPHGDFGSRKYLLASLDQSLKRMGLPYVDVFYSHRRDPHTPLEETMAAFTELQQVGKIRFAAASNYTGARLREASMISKQHGFIEYSALQNHYNLLEREEYERDSVPALAELGIEGVPFFGLARGFLSGKYREGVQVESVRASGVTKYTNEHGWAVLAKLDRLANHHSVSVSAIALAWLRQQPSVAAPKSFTTTFAPRAARPSACERPNPAPAPVTIATRPSNLMLI